ncbi:MAG: oligosaccharide flippase family protein [Turicibacter sp.]|nr:oligosaccharide flippase family protein [Turicibacter sp.]
MKKQTVTQATLILTVAGFITRALGLFNRVIITRLLGLEGLGIFVLINPTLQLLIVFAQLGLLIAVPALLGKNIKRQKKVLSAGFLLALGATFISSIGLYIFARPLADYFLQDERAYLPLLLIIPHLFCIVVSTTLRAYFQGEENATPYGISQIVEQIVRIGASFWFVSAFLPHGVVFGVAGIMLASIVGEIAQIFILGIAFLSHLRKNHKGATLKYEPLTRENFQDVTEIAFPATGSRLIGSFSHFLEPIIVVFALSRIGFTNDQSHHLFTAVSGLAMALLLLPNFITLAVNQFISSPISRAYEERNYQQISNHLNNGFQISFLLCGLFTVMVMVFPQEILKIIYGNDAGMAWQYLVMAAPAFMLLYFQGPLTTTLQATDRSKTAFKTSTITSIIKVAMMLVLMQIPALNIYGLIIAVSVNQVLLTLWELAHVRKHVRYKMNFKSTFNGALILGITYLFGYYVRATTLQAGETLRMFILMGIISAAYVLLVFLCNLFPTFKRQGGQLQKNDTSIISQR